ncbi:hypothetical protein [Gramella sp. KN1008]|uniref:hypothetical protein n=1 Tax=Gramella sp. KN1008 TaxID=2529298 RepID=UPI00103B4F16|nr:hypothetical protein [Gramella sp. KN1008]TBW27830.1 hypothetical protein EZJ28_08800 [Gramella sp. KN1008]
MNCFRPLLLILIFSFLPVQDEFVIFQAEDTGVKTGNNQYEISLPFKILDGYYIQAEKGVPENIIPTQVTFQKNKLYEITGYEILPLEEKSIFLDTIEHKVWSNDFRIRVLIKVNDKSRSLTKQLTGEVVYQACNNKQCFYPRNLNFEIDFI